MLDKQYIVDVTEKPPHITTGLYHDGKDDVISSWPLSHFSSLLPLQPLATSRHQKQNKTKKWVGAADWSGCGGNVTNDQTLI